MSPFDRDVVPSSWEEERHQAGVYRVGERIRLKLRLRSSGFLRCMWQSKVYALLPPMVTVQVFVLVRQYVLLQTHTSMKGPSCRLQWKHRLLFLKSIEFVGGLF